MTRIAVLGAIMVLASALPLSAMAESYRAGPLGAWDQNGEVTCEGGEMLLFPDGEFAVVPHAADDRTVALIDTRSGRAKVGGNADKDLVRLRSDPAICAGPIDCDDWDALGEAMKKCWDGPGDR